MSHPVQKREAFLIEVYHEYHPGRDAFNFTKSKRKERASRLIDELRNRYDVNKPVWMSYSFHSDTTSANVSENGKYALD